MYTESLTKLEELTDSLEDLEYKYYTFFKLSPDPLCILSQDGKIIKANAAWSQLGWSFGELEGVPCFDFIHPEDVFRLERHLRLLRNGKTSSFTVRFKTPGGGYKTIEITASGCDSHGLSYALVRVE